MILGLFGVAFVAGAIYLWRTGAVTPLSVKAWLESLGSTAPVIFIGAFVAGTFIGLPSMAFVVGGRLAFGPYVGFGVGFVGAMLAVTVPFVVARRVRRAGADPWRPKQRHLAKLFDTLDHHPYRTVLLLRLVLWCNLPMSYALAFTTVSARTYLLACATALAPVITLAMITTSWFL